MHERILPFQDLFYVLQSCSLPSVPSSFETSLSTHHIAYRIKKTLLFGVTAPSPPGKVRNLHGHKQTLLSKHWEEVLIFLPTLWNPIINPGSPFDYVP